VVEQRQRQELMDEAGSVAIECSLIDSGWECRVELPGDRRRSYVVGVSRAELARFAPGHFDPTVLVAKSFRFLLERESAESILRTFRISDIETYFPEYPVQIAALMRQ
jgi:hypothetical protein